MGWSKCGVRTVVAIALSFAVRPEAFPHKASKSVVTAGDGSFVVDAGRRCELCAWNINFNDRIVVVLIAILITNAQEARAWDTEIKARNVSLRVDCHGVSAPAGRRDVDKSDGGFKILGVAEDWRYQRNKHPRNEPITFTFIRTFPFGDFKS